MDMHVDQVRNVVELVVPDMLGNRLTGEDLVGVPHQEFKQAILLGREGDRLTAALDRVVARVERQLRHFENGTDERGLTARQGADARQQLGKREWLYEVVVRAAVEPSDAILNRITSSEHEYRRCHPTTPARVAHCH